jgi:enoyl-CoA hydratase/carnithine racemase
MLQTTDHGTVRQIRLDRPPVNALSPELVSALLSAVREASREVQAVVLSGSPKRFSGGLDIPHLMQLDREAIRHAWEDFFDLMEALATCPIPIAAAVTGHAPAGGTVLALFCDYRVMAEGAFRLGLNEVRVGLPLPEPIFLGLRRLVGARVAERLAVEGRLIAPEEALEVGLVDEIAPLEEVEARALAWCRSLLELPPQSMLTTRKQARAALADVFAAREERRERIDSLVESWFSEECRRSMEAMLAGLAKKKGA